MQNRTSEILSMSSDVQKASWLSHLNCLSASQMYQNCCLPSMYVCAYVCGGACWLCSCKFIPSKSSLPHCENISLNKSVNGIAGQINQNIGSLFTSNWRRAARYIHTHSELHPYQIELCFIYLVSFWL